jgi:hypothetical protein
MNMNCTEEEAKKKWCPMVRIMHENVVANRSDGYGDEDNVSSLHCCIASGCMMWVVDYGAGYGHCGLMRE